MNLLLSFFTGFCPWLYTHVRMQALVLSQDSNSLQAQFDKIGAVIEL